jgi:cell migration-inducing and hyaluronan-binding protein
MDQGSWVIFKLPGFATADSGTELNSLAALRAASETSWFSDGDSLWVKLVVADPPEMPIRPLNMQAGIIARREGRDG